MVSDYELNALGTLYIQEIIVNMEDTPVEKPTILAEYIEDDKSIQLQFFQRFKAI